MKKTYNEKLDFLTGEFLIEKLLTGYKIIWHNFDGWDWHLLIEQTDKTKETGDANTWRWLYLATSEYNDIPHKSFSHLTSYRMQTRKSVIRKVNKEYYADMFHKESMAKKETEKISK